MSSGAGQMCEAAEWPGLTGCLEECSNEATHTESWFDDEGVEVDLCDDHAT
jgi:hypothetical protein